MASDSPALPSAPVINVGPNVVLQPPLSRCGRGPGLVLITPTGYGACQDNNKSLDPPPLQKWAEESFAVAQISLSPETSERAGSVLEQVRMAQHALETLAECDKKDKFGLIGENLSVSPAISLISTVYGSRADFVPQFGGILQSIAAAGKFAGAVCFDDWKLSDIPSLIHLDKTKPEAQSAETSKVYSYSEVSSSGFIIPGHADFDYPSAGVAHSRTLTFIKSKLGAPYFDLEKIWDEHTYLEFGERSVEKTMATMVQEPYVNHVSTVSL